MKSSDVRRKYIEFFRVRGHAEIPSAPLVPENDPTTLFNSAGMQPLISYILGQPHPSGKRLVNSQKAVRTQDIEEVGDNRHTTFFEMLGNWSLGDYFKKEQLPWVFEFLTQEIGLDPKKLYVSVFEGNESVSKDTQSIEIWKDLFSGVGIEATEGQRIFTYPAEKNWWSRAGVPDNMPSGEPGGPDSEVFFDFGEELGLHEKSAFKNEKCHPNCDCGRFMEIANSVFMQYVKQADGTLEELSDKVVDFCGGLERMAAASIDDPDVFKTDLFTPLISLIEKLSKKSYGDNEKETRAMRIVADHIKGAVMMMADGVLPSNKMQGYILRRLIRRAMLYAQPLGLGTEVSRLGELVSPVGEIYKESYPSVFEKADKIKLLFNEEALRFGKSLERGLKEIGKVEKLTGEVAFTMYETYGFPWEMTEEIARQRGQQPDRNKFEEEFEKHKTLSRTAAKGMFKGGLADQSEQTTKLHTATHLLHQSLRTVLGNHVSQKGSNITVERLRFDFSHPKKLTDEETKKVEVLVNEQISKNLVVSYKVMTYDEAVKEGALAFFGQRYPEKVKVYSMGTFSKEICGGPHVDHTGVLGTFKIVKEESAASGVRRIYARLIL